MVRYICLVSPLCHSRIARIARIVRIARAHARGRPTAKQSCTINTTALSSQFRWSDVGYINKFIVNIVASSFQHLKRSKIEQENTTWRGWRGWRMCLREREEGTEKICTKLGGLTLAKFCQLQYSTIPRNRNPTNRNHLEI
mgnify:CR=1 FL=1